MPEILMNTLNTFLQQGDSNKVKSKGWQQKNKGTKKASKSKKKKPLKKKPVPPSLQPPKQQKQKQANGVAHKFIDILILCSVYRS